MIEFGAIIQLLPAVALFISQHWDSIVAVCTALVVGYQALKTREYAKIWPTLLEMIKSVSEKELSGPEKRKEVAAELNKILPLWLKPMVNQTELEKLVEQAYQYLKGELKSQEKTTGPV